MPVVVFSGGGASGGFSMSSWDAGFILSMIASTDAQVTGSPTLMTYTLAPQNIPTTLTATGTFSNFDAFGDPQAGTVTGFTYTTQWFTPGVDSTITVSGLSLAVPTINGWAATMNTEALQNALFGGADTMTGGAFGDVLNGYGGDGDDVLFGAEGGGPDAANDGADVMHGGAGNDALIGEGGGDFLYGDDGNDWVYGGIGNDTIYGGAGNDVLAGEDGDDNIDGGDGDDFIFGAYGFDILNGGAGNDWIDASFDGGWVIGGAGADSLFGGGNTTFLYFDVSESTEAAADVIGIFWRPGGDVINVSLVDADTTQDGDQAFTLVDAFTNTAGQAVISFDGTNSVARFDVDGDGVSDMSIVVLGVQLEAGDFVL